MDLIGSWAESVSAAIGIRPWAITVFLIVLVALLLDFFQRKLMRRLEKVVSETANLWDDAIFLTARRPLTLVVWVVGITLAAQMIPAREEGGLLNAELIISIRQIGVLYAITWFLYALVRSIENNIIEKARRDGREIDKTTVKALGRVVRITIVVTAVLVGLDTLGFNIAG